MNKAPTTPTKRPANISPARLLIEAHLKANLTTPTTTLELARIANTSTQLARNILGSMALAGTARQTAKTDRQNRWVWHTSSIASHCQAPAPAVFMPHMARPRTHVNAAMPNGDASYWRQAMAWGR